ncbi:MAG: hypothetical protein UU87_C0003G0205 [Parcubacteria group bacterium GW2011_GWA2_42_11]|nr:MAG: hypothetical protein UU87_C0003G0205 [Parcubacteria group bacterium GW2011_GWA2_42_11]
MFSAAILKAYILEFRITTRRENNRTNDSIFALLSTLPKFLSFIFESSIFKSKDYYYEDKSPKTS